MRLHRNVSCITLAVATTLRLAVFTRVWPRGPLFPVRADETHDQRHVRRVDTDRKWLRRGLWRQRDDFTAAEVVMLREHDGKKGR